MIGMLRKKLIKNNTSFLNPRGISETILTYIRRVRDIGLWLEKMRANDKEEARVTDQLVNDAILLDL